jgi:ATP-dependent phosphoenolpyruvate carboxykinase
MQQQAQQNASLDVKLKFYVVRTVHFKMKLYNDQRNAHVFVFISLSTSALLVSGLKKAGNM